MPSVPAIERQASDPTQSKSDVENEVERETKNDAYHVTTDNNINRVSVGEDWLATRTRTLREFFKLNVSDSLVTAEDDDAQLAVTRESTAYLETFNRHYRKQAFIV